MDNTVEIKKKGFGGKILIVVAFMIAAIVLLIVGLNTYYNGPKQQLKKHLDLGAKYLSELEYEQAVAAYELALEIDPKCADAYIGMAEAYAGLGDYEEAVRVLDEGISQIDNEDDRKRLEYEREILLEHMEDTEQEENAGEDTAEEEAVNSANLSDLGDEIVSGFASMNLEGHKLYMIDYPLFISLEERRKLYGPLADKLDIYIALYKEKVGTQGVSCGERPKYCKYDHDPNGYLSLTSAYDLAVYANLMTENMDRAWNVRSEQAADAGNPEILEGFSVTTENGAINYYDGLSRRIGMDIDDQHFKFVYGTGLRIEKMDYGTWYEEYFYDEEGRLAGWKPDKFDLRNIDYSNEGQIEIEFCEVIGDEYKYYKEIWKVDQYGYVYDNTRVDLRTEYH